MPIEIVCTVFSVETYNGKNGLGCNVVLLNSAEKGKFEVNTNDEKLINKFMKAEGSDVIIKAKLNQNKFGIRVEVLDIGA